jgi:peptide/nickel transport system substrate-binding protein
MCVASGSFGHKGEAAMTESLHSGRSSDRRSVTRRRLLAVAGAGSAALLAAACGGGGPGGDGTPAVRQSTGGAPAKGGTLKIGYHQDPAYLTVRASRSGFDPNFLFVNGDAFVYVKPDGTVDAANSLWQTYEWADPTTLVAKLRQGVTFHDGTPFNAEAVKAHVSYLTDKTKARDFGYAAVFEPVRSVETPDAGTVRLLLKEPNPAIVTGLGVQPGMPFSLAQVEKLGDDERLKPAMTGPYKVDAYTSGAGWTYVKNPQFWGPKDGTPYLDTIEFRVLTERASRGAALEAGDIDAAWFDDSDDTTVRLSKNKAFTQAKMFAGPTLLSLNVTKPPLDNLKVRQALAHAIDKAKVLEVINKGQGTVSSGGLLPPGTYGAVEHNPYPFNVAKARQLLQEAGVPLPARVRMIYSGSGSSNPAALTAQIYQSTLNSVGFQVELDNQVGNAQFDEMFDKGNAHLCVFSTGVRPDPDPQFSLYVTSYAYYNAGRASKDPAQARLDDLVAKGRVELDPKKREATYQDVTRVMIDNVLVAIPIVDRVRWVFAKPKVQGVEDPNFMNTPAGASFRARLLSLQG